jgi:hypothetical protein
MRLRPSGLHWFLLPMQILNQIHTQWYEQWDARPSQENKPAITSIIASLKSAVLANVSIVFSSVIPLQQLAES